MNESDFIEIVKDGAHSMFEQLKTVRATLVAVPAHSMGPDGVENIIFADIDPIMDDKAHVARLIHQVRTSSPFSAFLSEVWISKQQMKEGETAKEAMKKAIKPVDDPNRTEAVMAHVYLGMQVRMLYAEIIRPDGSDPILADWKEMEGKSLGWGPDGSSSVMELIFQVLLKRS